MRRDTPRSYTVCIQAKVDGRFYGDTAPSRSSSPPEAGGYPHYVMDYLQWHSGQHPRDLDRGRTSVPRGRTEPAVRPALLLGGGGVRRSFVPGGGGYF